MNQAKALNIGCGPSTRWIPNIEGIDIQDFGQKYVGDFITYDFKGKKFDVVFAHHVIEHLPDTIAFFNKIGEVLNVNGTLDIRVPVLPFTQAFQDPTHVKFISGPEYFTYFTKDSPAGHCYSKPEFKLDYFESDRFEWELHVKMTRIK